MSELSEAIEAYTRGGGFDWCISFLNGRGNNLALSRRLQSRARSNIELRHVSLDRLRRIIGPEAGMRYAEEPATWELRIERLVSFLRSGGLPPPLIVTDLWGEGEIADGNHRHQALVRCGYAKYWAFYFES